MNKRNPPKIRNEIIAEASAWFVEFSDNPEDQSIREAFDRWVRRSPEHVQAYLQISVHWEDGVPRPNARVESVDELIALAKTGSSVVRLTSRGERPSAVRQESSTSEAIDTPRVRTQAVRSPEFRLRRRTHRHLALAASILLGFTAGVTVWQQLFRGVYSTEIGEQRSLTLADGSTVELNSRSRIRVRYTQQARHIDLLEGQALFHVAKSTSRPFIVQSQNAQVRAVGTQFDVYRKRSGTIVTVVEGRVAVVPARTEASMSHHTTQTREPPGRQDSANPANSRADGIGTPSNSFGVGSSEAPSDSRGEDEVLLTAGEQLTLGLGGAETRVPTRPQPANVEAATAWTRHRLIFKGAPLSEVVEEFNRYSRRPLVITDSTIGATRISGSFLSSDPVALLRFLREVGAYNVHETPSAVEISRK
jgi:transmembrane sensor